MFRSLAVLPGQAVIGILTIGNRSEKEAIDNGTLAVEVYRRSRGVAHDDVSESRATQDSRGFISLAIFPGTSVPDYIYPTHADFQLHEDKVMSRYWLWSFAPGSLSPLAPLEFENFLASPVAVVRMIHYYWSNMWKHSQKIDCPYDASEMEAWLPSPNHIGWFPTGNLGKSGPQTFPE